ncbi:hypothetical protein BVX99_00380, partial [bacterium F16]
MVVEKMRKGPARRDREGAISEPYIGIFRTVQYTPMLDQNISMTVFDDATLQASGYQLPATFYYNQDERQSVRNLTASDGSMTNTYDYTAYGDKVDSLTSGSISQRYTYTGRELNETSGDYYFRNRMYGAGGFLSRDPMGYVDGASVYGGYFAMRNSRDASGRNLTAVTCLTEANRLKVKDPQISRLIGILIKGGCPLKKFVCNECCEDGDEDKETGGYYDRETKNKIVFCAGNLPNKKYMRLVFLHELRHAADDCLGQLKTCEDIACSEIRAAASDGGCDANGLERNPGESKRSCVIRRARWSVEGAEC